MSDKTPPNISYTSPFVDVTVALPCNLDAHGRAIKGPIPSEAALRQLMMDFVEKVRAHLEAAT